MEKKTYMHGPQESPGAPSMKKPWRRVQALDNSSETNLQQERDLLQRVFQTRLSYNYIRSFQLLLGVFIDDPLVMSLNAVQHFQSILGPLNLDPPPIISTLEWFSSLTGYICTMDLAAAMTLIPYAEEITRTMFKLNPNQAPSLDGLTA
ncbi:hypothetical protein YC2023_002798 [Brassica napus]